MHEQIQQIMKFFNVNHFGSVKSHGEISKTVIHLTC